MTFSLKDKEVIFGQTEYGMEPMAIFSVRGESVTATPSEK